MGKNEGLDRKIAEDSADVRSADSTTSAQASKFPIVGVGASAGGMESFIELLRLIPTNAGMAFVLIQHLDPTHTSYLSEALGRSTSFPVHEIEDGMRVEPDHVYVIPSDADVGILDGRLSLLPRATQTQERKRHLPIDRFFRALAADRGSEAIGIILSGTGADGSEGLRAIKAEDGVTFVQDPASAKFSGMPEAAIATGAVDFAQPIPELVDELLQVVRRPFRRPREGLLSSPETDTEIRKILSLLRREGEVDFSEYKLSSIRRRLARRLALRRIATLEEYVHLLGEDPAELKALFEDILIHVTSYFRDGTTFEKLKEHVFPEILKHKQGGDSIRIWSAGCSTGEEAYSLVIALLEFLAQENASDFHVQLFGTDVAGSAIDSARAGFYSEASLRDIGAERLERFFTKQDDGGYCVAKSVREKCAFVKHDLARDPPFSKLDLVCCRNVLIYFGQELQKRVLSTFHFALNDPGFLLLGRAENVPDGTNLFRVVDKENRIFARTAGRSSLPVVPRREASPVALLGREPRIRASPAFDVVRRSESVLLDAYAPAGVIVNEHMEILHFRGRTGPYLEPAPGQPHHDLVKMARKGLVADLRIAISQARKGKTTIRRPAVRFDHDGTDRVCDVVVIPVASAPESRENIFAVLFEEPKPTAAPTVTEAAAAAPTAGHVHHADVHGVAALEKELRATKDYLQSIIEDHQRANDELQAANEDLISSNEELQTLNEELQTAKEELQSTNEELSTLNEELHTRNTELNSVNSDLINILGSVEVPIVIVDGNRRIRRFTPKARPILNLLPTDVGRPIDDIKPNLVMESLDQKIAEVIETVTPHEEEVHGRDGRWYRLQIRPYMTVEKRIEGAVLSVVDVDVLKRALGAAEWARDYAVATVEAVQTPLLVLDDKRQIVFTNAAFRECYALTPAESEGHSLYEILSGALNVPALSSTLERGERFGKLPLKIEIPNRGVRYLSLAGRSVPMPSRERLTLLAMDDITEERQNEAERERLLRESEAAKASAEDANRTKDVFLATLSHELRTPLSALLMQAQLLRSRNIDATELQKASEVIERATRAQAQLIDDLLDISRIVTGKLQMAPEAVSLASVVERAIEIVAAIAEKKHIDIEADLDYSLPAVFGDALRLQQVVANLLTNAVKFTLEGGRVVVTVDSVDGFERIRVSDTGIGIDPSFLPHIFNRFSQEMRGQTRSHGGLGLGLAIVRHVVEAHGGTVRAESSGRGEGSTFTVLLPKMKSEPALAAHSEHAQDALSDARLGKARLLIVEDDEQTREILTKMLSLSCDAVRSAESAAKAMTIVQEFKPDLLICDIAMPEEDGYSFLRRLRKLGPEHGGDVPALALSALAGDEDRRRAFEAGFQAHVAKPIDIRRLLPVLVELLGRPQAFLVEPGRRASDDSEAPPPVTSARSEVQKRPSPGNEEG